MPHTDKTKRRAYMKAYRAANPHYVARDVAQRKAREEGNPSLRVARNTRASERLKTDPEYAERRREGWRVWAKKNRELLPEKHRAVEYRRRYGITIEAYDLMVEEQQNQCNICGKDQVGRKRWHIDHDHVTGAVRALLCSNCNTLLGLAKDNTDILRAAITYLERYPCSAP